MACYWMGSWDLLGAASRRAKVLSSLPLRNTLKLLMNDCRFLTWMWRWPDHGINILLWRLKKLSLDSWQTSGLTIVLRVSKDRIYRGESTSQICAAHSRVI